MADKEKLYHRAYPTVSGTVAVVVLTGGSDSVITSLARAVTTSVVSSAFITALLPYSLNRHTQYVL
mgnify:CR=1 FL=1